MHLELTAEQILNWTVTFIAFCAAFVLKSIVAEIVAFKKQVNKMRHWLLKNTDYEEEDE